MSAKICNNSDISKFYGGFLLLEFFEAAAGVTGIGVELEGLLVVADGGVGHVLVLALAAHDGIFGGEACDG